MISSTSKLAACLFAAVVSLGSVSADPYQKGSAVAAFHAKDQHGQALAFVPADTRFLLVSHDMETGKKANAALSAKGKDFLDAKKAVYLANIHGMPAIGRTFALPKMRKYTHRIILGDDAGLIARFPEEKGKVTVLGLAGGKVKSIGYWNPAEQAVDEALK